MLIIGLLSLGERTVGIGIAILCLVLLAAVVFAPKIYRLISNRLSSDEKARTSILPEKIRENGKISFNALEEIIDTVGYAYNPEKDIFFSTMEAWQRKMGYCRLYDEAAAPLGMIIDSEPIYFSYEGKRWLIEFWKGQYGMTTGCEVGVYTSGWPDLNIPDVFNGTFYTCASDRDRLYMKFYLKKNGKTIVSRKHKHWWLTGFRLGEFSEPSELILDIYITLKDKRMRNIFVEALRKAGYTDDEFETKNNIVAIRFDKPHSKQPYSRTSATDSIVLKRNKMFCDQYQSITQAYSSLSDKLTAVKEQSPDLYKEVLNIGKTLPLFDKFSNILEYLKININETPTT
jgi:hypothetical protein